MRKKFSQQKFDKIVAPGGDERRKSKNLAGKDAFTVHIVIDNAACILTACSVDASARDLSRYLIIPLPSSLSSFNLINCN